MSSKPHIALIGPGNLGSALGRALVAAGYPVDELVTRSSAASISRARVVGRKIGVTARGMDNAHLASSVTILCVPDDAIAVVAKSLAKRGSWRGKTVLHTSGALGSDMLGRLKTRGAHVGTLHPMQSFVRTSPAEMSGIWFGVEGDLGAVRVARRIALDLGAKVIPIEKRNKALYHALGSFSSPMLIAVLALAEQIAKEARIPRGARRGLMEPILRRTFDNYFARGAAAAFSGPLVRGDITTVRAHMKELRRVPGALEVYRALVRSALRTLPVGKRREIAKLVGD